MAQWLSWLERRPVTAEVESSSLFWVVCTKVQQGIIAQLGEHLPYKQGVIGSSPICPIMDGFPSGQRGQTVNLLSTTSKVRILLHPLAERLEKNADVAQLAEQLICNQQVIGSSPIIGFERKLTIKYYRGVEQSGSSSGS